MGYTASKGTGGPTLDAAMIICYNCRGEGSVPLILGAGMQCNDHSPLILA